MKGSPVKKIRVLVADDSAFRRALIIGMLESDPAIHVVAEARTGKEALDKTLESSPDVITMDILMPVMDGIEAIRQIMSVKPTPIVVVSATIQDEQKFAFNCLKFGALDFVPVSPDTGIIQKDLIARVKTCSKIKVITHVRRPHGKTALPKTTERYEIIGVAVSTGGPPALQQFLSLIPVDFPVPIVIVQHISTGFVESLAGWLEEQSHVKVTVAKEGDKPKPGIIYLAPDHHHLTVDNLRRFKLLKDDYHKIHHKPSADIMLKSLAKIYGPKTIGIIMTGMGRDGAAGIKAIKEAGGITIAQDEESSLIYGMNKTAIDEGSAVEILPLALIARRIAELTA